MIAVSVPTKEKTTCYHCGENCDDTIVLNDHSFCCEGCKFVYQLLNENDLCNYYDLSSTPGIKAKGRFRSDRFAYLDHEATQQKLLRFSDMQQAHVQFHLPQMHCASCIWLLENLHRIEPGILQSKTNFQTKEIFIVYDLEKTSLRKTVELLAFVGYEPTISLENAAPKKQKKINRAKVFRIGVAGFAFSNIMMMSFPEYFAGGSLGEKHLQSVFSYLNLALSLPVLFYSASEFFVSAWKGLQQRWLNIDAPIALAILVTFSRSAYEIITATGPGYLDSMSGIVFFMLVGRWFQDKTYDAFSFDRDYKAYFPLGVTRMQEAKEESIPVNLLQKGDRILVRNEEMIPADAVLLRGNASIDYSFVSGENKPVHKQTGALIYAGGKQKGAAIELEVVAPVSQSYITQLWNNDIFQHQKHKEQSFIHPWSRYFTVVLFTIALLAAAYWWWNDASKILPAVTSILIVACPCSLLLTVTFSFGSMQRIFGRNHFYLKNAAVIESIRKINTIVLDKTGTLTHSEQTNIQYEGDPLSALESNMINATARQSSHPLSRQIAGLLQSNGEQSTLYPETFQEFSGKGMEAAFNGTKIRIGSGAFVGETHPQFQSHDTGTHVYVTFDNIVKGKFSMGNAYRDGIAEMGATLGSKNYELHVLSGDNDFERNNLQKLFGEKTPLLFRQSPQDKLNYIASLQEQGKKVMMLGDGLNDAGALRQSDVGIAVSDQTSQFSPASDGILDGGYVNKLHLLIDYAKAGQRNIIAIFILSMLYNMVGLYFATQALLSPLIAAILMPASSISIVILSSLLSNISARKRGL